MSCMRVSVPMTTKHLSFRFNIRFLLLLPPPLSVKRQLFLKKKSRLSVVAGGTFSPCDHGDRDGGMRWKARGELRVSSEAAGGANGESLLST